MRHIKPLCLLKFFDRSCKLFPSLACSMSTYIRRALFGWPVGTPKDKLLIPFQFPSGAFWPWWPSFGWPVQKRKCKNNFFFSKIFVFLANTMKMFKRWRNTKEIQRIRCYAMKLCGAAYSRPIPAFSPNSGPIEIFKCRPFDTIEVWGILRQTNICVTFQGFCMRAGG